MRPPMCRYVFVQRFFSPMLRTSQVINCSASSPASPPFTAYSPAPSTTASTPHLEPFYSSWDQESSPMPLPENTDEKARNGIDAVPIYTQCWFEPPLSLYRPLMSDLQHSILNSVYSIRTLSLHQIKKRLSVLLPQHV